MTWRITDVQAERTRFIKAWLTKRHTVADLARAFGVSERIAHKTIRRFKEEGFDGLEDRSRARRTQDTIDATIAAAVVDARRTHPTWGPRKLRALLMNEQPDVGWPAASTMGALLVRHGLVVPRRRRRARLAPTHPCVDAVAPNDSWSMDYKGQFRTVDGRLCYPFTVTDNASRYILCCKGLRSPNLADTWRELVACFREHGLPTAIRSDNGSPFAGTGLTRLSKLSVRLIKLDVVPDFIAPGSPQQNGRHERMHRTLKQDATKPPAANLGAQQRRFNRFVHEFNALRPHEALDNRVPADVHVRSRREMPSKTPVVEYGERDLVRSVRSDGSFQWRKGFIFLAEPLIGERVALDPIDDGFFIVRFARHPIAVLDDAARRLHPAGTRPWLRLKQRDRG